ncbi:MAG: DUF5783 family protein [Halobacteriaceae archaeon]
MTEALGFTPAEFEEKKYTDYFPHLQQAYKQAFQEVNETYDSDLVHAIDQTVFSESEPVYEGDGEFRIDLPEDPLARIASAGVIAGDDRAQAVLDAYVEALEASLRETLADADTT